jgi:hypothetical protein
MTCLVYLLANTFTYHLGTSGHCGKPLKDILHDMLPDLSRYVYVRDIVLIALTIPFLYIKQKLIFLYELWDSFMLVVLIKAVSIFFTFIPPSNPDCEHKKYLNHCFHSSTSGHASLCLMLFLYYIKFGLFQKYTFLTYVIVFLYCLLILMTRAHYTVDIAQAIVITILLTV